MTVVAACAILVRIFAAARPRYKGSSEPSFLPTVLAALVGGMIVLLYGILATKRSAQNLLLKSRPRTGE